ncbi:hypothetical protein ARMSODRAFT_733 [Armillaria solidipes]|uniref:Uncharacterized protein n=1 Tax=Armillaria solidipes TaxID=1076256 RepID=A0A2H3C8I8_9AGAR|nr:hypothetical protein ARMSODRAFT_733 [Armillaria solidipes]
MSSAAPPSQRGHCLQVTDNIYYCRCLSFAPHASPLQDPFSCATCGHSIHTHVDHLPGFVHRPPTSHYAAHALEGTPTTQECICMMQLVWHTAVLNPHRPTALNRHITEPFEAGSHPEQGPPPHINITSPSGDIVNSLAAPTELITSRRPTVPDPYHPTDWAYRMTFFTGGEAVFSTSASSSSGVVPLYAPRATHPHSNINLLPVYTQAHSSGTIYSFDDSMQHGEHMDIDSDYGICQTNATAEGSTVQQDYQIDDVIVQSDQEAHESSY